MAGLSIQMDISTETNREKQNRQWQITLNSIEIDEHFMLMLGTHVSDRFACRCAGCLRKVRYMLKKEKVMFIYSIFQAQIQSNKCNICKLEAAKKEIYDLCFVEHKKIQHQNTVGSFILKQRRSFIL